MAKKKRKSQNIAARPSVRLSQCMIVKNEEKNIERALSWGKGIVCEQIVVDTGSTDHTVEIAERMGAKVLQFQWVNDFSAAKNFAIEQATGNWIAFLDADEYIEDDEAKLVLPLLEKIMSDPKMSREHLAVNCPWIQLDDYGRQKEVLTQERIFQNQPRVRYVGRIHEKLSLEMKNCVFSKDFRIMHTGYTGESFILTGKAGRNVAILREEMRANPKNISNKAYLAEALQAEALVEKATTENPDAETLAAIEAKLDEADKLFKEVAGSRDGVEQMHKKTAYEYFMRKYSFTAETDPELDMICAKAHREFPDDPKIMCYYAMALNKKGDFRGALDVLKNCEAILNKDSGNNSELTTKITDIFAAQMVLAAQGLGDIETVIKYAEVMLLMNKTNKNVLQPYISKLVKHYASDEEVINALARVYDMNNKGDIILIATAAKNCGAIELARRIVGLVSS